MDVFHITPRTDNKYCIYISDCVKWVRVTWKNTPVTFGRDRIPGGRNIASCFIGVWDSRVSAAGSPSPRSDLDLTGVARGAPPPYCFLYCRRISRGWRKAPGEHRGGNWEAPTEFNKGEGIKREVAAVSEASRRYNGGVRKGPGGPGGWL